MVTKMTGKTMTRLGILGAIPLAALGLAGGVLLVQAQDSSPTPAHAQAADQAGPMADDFIKRLAANLGVDEQKLRDALKKTGAEVIDQAVADGKMDQAMADKIKAMIESGSFDDFDFSGMHGSGGPHEGKPGMPFSGGPASGFGGFSGFGGSIEAITGFLGLSIQELMAEMSSGKSLTEVAEAHGKTRDELKAFILAEAAKGIDQAVADGKLTAEKAQKAKDQLASSIDQMLDMKIGAMIGGSRRSGGVMPFSRP
jgi:polyhydroxyalkanoate synthesis regulator phasin